jgi:hypothetical protein
MKSWFVCSAVFLGMLAVVACGDDESPATVIDTPDSGGSKPEERPDAGSLADSGSDAADGGIVHEPVAYAHSFSELYKLNTVTKAFTKVGDFDGGCGTVIDLAVDANERAFVTTFDGLYRLDVKTAKCELIKTGSFPNSLSFVPKGTLDDNEEVLVGYQGATYVRINTTTGAVDDVGRLTGGYSSSGDIASAIGGSTYLTVNGNGCSDCLVEINPKTGDLVRNHGSVNHTSVYGLAQWDGVLYGFANDGKVFSITWANDVMSTTDIELPSGTPTISFAGAGSTTWTPPAQ